MESLRIGLHGISFKDKKQNGKMAYVTGNFPIKIALGFPHNPVSPGTTANFD